MEALAPWFILFTLGLALGIAVWWLRQQYGGG